MPQEIEIRLAARPDDLQRLGRDSALDGFTAGRPVKKRLSTVYYDTEGLGFAKAGLSLRVRKIGRSYVQTVKNENSGALASERRECENKLSSPEPDLASIADPDLRERLQSIVSEGAVTPVIQTDIVRTTRALKTETGAQIELALDRGEIRTLLNGHAVLPVNEVELELKAGSAVALYDVARVLSRKAPLTISIESKSERGIRALEGRDIAPAKAGRTDLALGCTAEEAFRATLLHCLQHIARNTASVAQARDPEGVHQIRVGLRRLRAALAAFGDAFRVRTIEELSGRAKALAAMFGPTRELDVFDTELLASVEKVAKKPGMPHLRLVLEELRRDSWDSVVSLVQSDDFTGFLLDLAAAAEARIWRESKPPEEFDAFLRPARDVASEALDKALKRCCKRAKHLSSLSTQERHRLRIALKRLRYSAEFFAPLFPSKTVSAFLMRLSKLQDLFGALNDVATEEHILKRILERAGDRSDVALHEAAAFVDGWHQSRFATTWKKAKKRWKQLAQAEPFWAA